MANEWDRLSVDDVIVELRNRGVTATVAMEVGARMLIEDDPAAALGLAQAAGVDVQPFEPVQQSNPWGGTVDVSTAPTNTTAGATVTSAGLTPQQHAEQGTAPPEATGATPPPEQLSQPQQPGQPDTAAAPAAPAPAPAPEQGQA